MPEDNIPQEQLTLTPKDFLDKLDFLNWYRYFAILKELSRLAPGTILEVGPGEGTIKRIFKPFVETYATMDLNPRLNPDFLDDVRSHQKEAEEKFNCVIAADILEHIPFTDLPQAAKNIFLYLTPGGSALITIPHRAWFVFGLTWLWDYRSILLRFPDGMRRAYHTLRGRTNPIDRDHQWEIGDGHHTISDVEKVFKGAGFNIVKREALLYVDFWVLRK